MTTPHIIEFYSATENVSGSLGGIDRTYPTTGRKLAAFVQFRSDNYAIINDTQGNSTVVVIYLPGVAYAKPYDRVKFNSAWYEVTGVLPGNGQRGQQYTKLTCSQNNQI